jgi:DNA-binding beta-propeller fold protein YncE
VGGPLAVRAPGSGGRELPGLGRGLLRFLVLIAVPGCAAGGAGLEEVGAPGGALLPDPYALEYRLYVTNESSDIVSRVVFDRVEGARVEREVRIGIMPADLDAPHGVAVSPDREHYYVTVAHGTPNGWLWQLRTGTDEVVARITLGRFPASVGTSPDGRFVFVVNFNLHGDMVPSDLSVVFAPELREVARIPSCVMPHGSRTNPSGTRHYHVCMHSDQLVEVSLSTFAVANRFSLHPGHEGLLSPDDRGELHGPHDPAEGCSPTWVAPGRGARAGRFVYLTCNRRDEVLEVDVEMWRVTRRFPTGRAPYNLEVTPDGRTLVVTLKGGQGIEVIDLDGGRANLRLPTTREITHGVVISPDGRYAFVTNESIGGLPGTLDVFDLAEGARVSSVELRLQPGGVDLWRVDPVGSGPAPARP